MKPFCARQTFPSLSTTHDGRSLCRLHGLILVVTVFLSLAVSLQAGLVNPDLTTTAGRDEALADGEVLNLGPTGLIGWLGHNNDDTSESRQILITSVYGSSPASGKLAVDDVILGVSGDGSTPVDFTSDARKAFALAIGEAEANNPAELKVKRWRSGSSSTQTLTLQNLGAYTATAPWSCPKSTAILEAAVEYTYDNEDSGKYSTNALALMAVRDLSLAGTNNNNRKNRARDWAKEAILSNGDIADLMNNEVDSGSGGYVSWPYGHKLIVLSEYYLQTGDSSVYPSIEALARGIANGMSVWGTMGHRFTQPSKIDGSLNGTYQWGYGTVNSAGLPCFLGLTLAKECGVNDSRVNDGIAAAARTFAGYANVGGSIPYGEHAASIKSSESNGKNSIAALALSRVAGFEDQAKTFGYMATSAAGRFGTGHTGSWFSKFWMPLGANLVGDAAAQTHFNDIKWRLDLARRHDGGFAFNDIYQGNNGTAGATWKGYGFWANTHAILAYAMPYGKLSITDNADNSAYHLTVDEVSAAAFASTYEASTRSNAELLTDLDHDIVQVGYAAAEEMGARSADHSFFLTELHAKLPNAAEPENGRMMACFALGQIADSGGSDSNTSAALVAALLEDSSLRIRYGAAFGLRYFPNSAKLSVTTEILNAVVNTAKPVFPKDAEDPMQLAHGQLCYLTVYSGSASGPTGYLKKDKIYTNNIDPALYRPAIVAAGKTAMGHARSGVGKIYQELTREDFEFLCPDIIETIEHQPSLDRMFGSGARAGGLVALQERGIADGVGLAKFVHWDLNMPGNESNRFTDALDTLKDYAGSSELVVPDQGIEAYLQSIVNNSGAGNEVINAQAVLDAIAADSNPTPLTSLKSLSVTADDTTLFSPAVGTTLHSGGVDLAQGDSVYTWSKVSGPGAVTFTPNGNASAADTVVNTDGTPGTYTFEVRMSDTRGYADTGNNASFANGYSEVTETIDITLGGQSVSVPGVLGLSQATAESTITAANLVVGDVTTAYSESVPVGEVISQAPAASTSVAEGSTVDLVVSLGSHSADAWVHEPFADADTTLTGNTPGAGLAGTWSDAQGTFNVNPGSLSYGSLPTSGNQVYYSGSNGSCQIGLGPGLAAAGLLDDGATLWFSILLDTPVTGGGNADTGFAIATDRIVGTNNIPLDAGQGMGFTIKHDRLKATTWDNAKNVGTGVSVPTDTTILVVGRLRFATNPLDPDTIDIYLPGTDLALNETLDIIDTQTAVLTQGNFDLVTFGLKTNTCGFDEIRFGATYDSVIATALPPTITATNIVDDQAGAPVPSGDLLTYTITFNEGMDDATVTASDFTNAGTSAVTVGTIAEISSGVFTVEVTPTDAGTLRLQIAAGAVLTDVAGHPLDTTDAIVDDTSIVVTPGNEYSDWIALYEVGDQTAFDDDRDGDGLGNGLEAWLGTHPGESNGGLVGLATDGTTTTFEHPQNETPPSDLSGFYEWSSDLDDWYACDGVDGPSGGPTVTAGTTTVGGATTVTTTASESLEWLFLRIGVIRH